MKYTKNSITIQGRVYSFGEANGRNMLEVKTVKNEKSENFGKDYPADSAEWMFTEGNYACDCNRSLFIRRQYGEDAMPELKCGDEIELIDYQIDERRF